MQLSYREIRELHDHLKLKYPDRIPPIPPKRIFGNNDPAYITDYYIALIMTFSSSEVWVLLMFRRVNRRRIRRIYFQKASTYQVLSPSWTMFVKGVVQLKYVWI